MTRSTAGEGTVYKTSDARRRAAVSLPDGQRRYLSGRTKGEVWQSVVRFSGPLKLTSPSPRGTPERWMPSFRIGSPGASRLGSRQAGFRPTPLSPTGFRFGCTSLRTWASFGWISSPRRCFASGSPP